MTTITQLNLTNCRHFASLSIEPCAGLNLITGPNASGKTSILEAIYVLAHGKSFRTNSLDKVIKQNQLIMTIFSQADVLRDTDKLDQLGLQRVKAQSTTLHLNKEAVRSIKALTEKLPIQLITTESTRFFTDGPKLRRDFLAWGLFYTNEAYYNCWKQYQRALAQRNRALKQRLSLSDLAIWDAQLVDSAVQLDVLNKAYLELFQPVFCQILQDFLPGLELLLSYQRGWSDDMTLDQALIEDLEKSYALGYTTKGPHRLDLQLIIDGKGAQHVLSRGQLKMASYALALAQGIVLKNIIGRAPIYLIDDLSAELDMTRQRLVFSVLRSLESQVFVSTIEPVGLETGFLVSKSFDLGKVSLECFT
jgi:DNA replication and repair protein RecF